MDLVHTEQEQPHRGADDVGDGIHRADFVEVDLLDRDAVHPRLGFAEFAENGGRVFLDLVRQSARVDHLQDVRQVAVGALLAAFDDEAGGGDAAAMYLLDAKRRAHAERIERRGERFERGPRVDERADRHVAGNSRKCVEVADLHAITSGSNSPARPRSEQSTCAEYGVSSRLISMTFAPAAFASGTSPAAG